MYKFTLQNSKFKPLIDDIVIDFWSYWNFARIKDVRIKCNLIVYLSKFIFNRKLLSGVVNLVYDWYCCQNLSKFTLSWPKKYLGQ